MLELYNASRILSRLAMENCVVVIQHIDVHRSDECRAKFMSDVTIYDPSMLLWIDESGCDKRNSLRKRAYSMKGMTPKDHRLLVRGKRFSAIPVMSTEGIHDVYLFEGNINGERFQEFTTNSLLPILNPFNWSNSHSVVIMLNAIVRSTRVSVHDWNMEWFSFMMLLTLLKTSSRGLRSGE